MNKRTSSTQRALILFTRDLVKDARHKKLAPSDDSQMLIYRYFLQHLSETITTAKQQLPFDLIIASDPSDRSTQKILQTLDPTLSPRIHSHPGVDFNTNISAALEQTVGRDYDEVVIIGNDCLDLTSEHISSAFQSLSSSEAVLGSAKDGGFYLLGLTRFEADFFDGIRWGSSSVSRKLLENLYLIGVQVDQLPSLGDIDNVQDLKSWIRTALNSDNALSFNLARTLRKLFICTPFIRWAEPDFSSLKTFTRELQQLPPPISAS